MTAKFYKVGGCIRDEILGLKSKDIDFAVECPSFEAMREAIVARGGKIFLETPQYFTIRANVPGLGSTDYVLCRRDGAYRDGRRPENVTPGTIADDLARRDFTCNAMARNVDTGELLDPHGGQSDLTERMLRCVGKPQHRLSEDALRAYRAVRFAVTKNLIITHELSNHLMVMQKHEFDGVSTERIREEMLKMFQRDPSFSIHLLTRMYPVLWDVALERGIWLKPTIETVKQ